MCCAMLCAVLADRVLMQKVAKELLGMLSWPGIAARLASAEGALGALSSECGVGSACARHCF